MNIDRKRQQPRRLLVNNDSYVSYDIESNFNRILLLINNDKIIKNEDVFFELLIRKKLFMSNVDFYVFSDSETDLEPQIVDYFLNELKYNLIVNTNKSEELKKILPLFENNDKILVNLTSTIQNIEYNELLKNKNVIRMAMNDIEVQLDVLYSMFIEDIILLFNVLDNYDDKSSYKNFIIKDKLIKQKTMINKILNNNLDIQENKGLEIKDISDKIITGVIYIALDDKEYTTSYYDNLSIILARYNKSFKYYNIENANIEDIYQDLEDNQINDTTLNFKMIFINGLSSDNFNKLMNDEKIRNLLINNFCVFGDILTIADTSIYNLDLNYAFNIENSFSDLGYKYSYFTDKEQQYSNYLLTAVTFITEMSGLYQESWDGFFNFLKNNRLIMLGNSINKLYPKELDNGYHYYRKYANINALVLVNGTLQKTTVFNHFEFNNRGITFKKDRKTGDPRVDNFLTFAKYRYRYNTNSNNLIDNFVNKVDNISFKLIDNNLIDKNLIEVTRFNYSTIENDFNQIKNILTSVKNNNIFRNFETITDSILNKFENVTNTVIVSLVNTLDEIKINDFGEDINGILKQKLKDVNFNLVFEDLDTILSDLFNFINIYKDNMISIQKIVLEIKDLINLENVNDVFISIIDYINNLNDTLIYLSNNVKSIMTDTQKDELQNLQNTFIFNRVLENDNKIVKLQKLRNTDISFYDNLLNNKNKIDITRYNDAIVNNQNRANKFVKPYSEQVTNTSFILNNIDTFFTNAISEIKEIDYLRDKVPLIDNKVDELREDYRIYYTELNIKPPLIYRYRYSTVKPTTIFNYTINELVNLINISVSEITLINIFDAIISNLFPFENNGIGQLNCVIISILLSNKLELYASNFITEFIMKEIRTFPELENNGVDFLSILRLIIFKSINYLIDKDLLTLKIAASNPVTLTTYLLKNIVSQLIVILSTSQIPDYLYDFITQEEDEKDKKIEEELFPNINDYINMLLLEEKQEIKQGTPEVSLKEGIEDVINVYGIARNNLKQNIVRYVDNNTQECIKNISLQSLDDIERDIDILFKEITFIKDIKIII